MNPVQVFTGMELVLTAMAVVAFVSYGAAAFIYGVFAPWQRTWVGRIMLMQMITVVLSFALVLFLRNAQLPDEYRNPMRLAIFTSFAISGVGLFLAIYVNQQANQLEYRRRKNAASATPKASADRMRKSRRHHTPKGTPMARHVEIAVPSTQVQFPNRSMWRTMVQVGLPAFLSGILLLPWIIDVVLDGYGQSMPDPVRGWLLGFAAFITVTAGVCSRIMSNPLVDNWIREHIKGLAPSKPENPAPQPVVIEPENPEPAVPQEPIFPEQPENPPHTPQG